MVEIVGIEVPALHEESFGVFFRDREIVLSPVGQRQSFDVALEVADEKVTAAEEDNVVGVVDERKFADAGVHYFGVCDVFGIARIILAGESLYLFGVRQLPYAAVLKFHKKVPDRSASFVPQKSQYLAVGGESRPRNSLAVSQRSGVEFPKRRALGNMS